MEISNGIVFSVGLLFEMIMLIAIWNWSVRRKMMPVLLGATTLVLVPIVISVMFRVTIPARAYLAFAGMYIFSGLVWRWWTDGIAPDRWRMGEISLAVLAMLMFSMAGTA
ncbi:MAG: hypothetical protein ABW128_08190 [Rhizorhabdus sp.]